MRAAWSSTGGCYDLTTTPPYGPWVETLRSYRPDDGLPPLPAFVADEDALASLGSQQALFAQTASFFSSIATQRPLVIVLDDVHWSDPGSLEFLRTWARSLRDNQILGVVSYRSDELTRRHPLEQLLPLLVREAQARRLTVAPLDNQAVGALISTRFPLEASDVDRLVAWLMERSEGNPFFLAELVQTLEEQRSLVPLADGHWRVGDLAQVRVPSWSGK